MKNVLVINSGSSSLKFQLIEMPSEKVMASGMVERIGLEGSKAYYKTEDFSTTKELKVPDHAVALKTVTELLMDEKRGVIESPEDINAIGHRVVHGGKTFSKTIVIDEEVKKAVKNLFSLAPLHNPANLKGIEVAEELFPKAIQVAVFDTAFHSTIPQKAAQYAIPNSLYEEDHIQVYGFHGTSHKYVTRQAQDYLKNDKLKIVSIHLGNGCSITAVKDGKSIDHSLGFAPVNGLIMGTRSGDIDQSVIFYMIEHLGYTPEQVSDILHKKSGMYGLTGYSDLRDIEEQAEQGNVQCQLALQMNAYRIKKYIGAYATIMNGLDAVIFTAGIGENSNVIRKVVCDDMDYLGFELDKTRNILRSKDIRQISTDASRVKVLVIPTNEELEIAKQVEKLVS